MKKKLMKKNKATLRMLAILMSLAIVMTTTPQNLVITAQAAEATILEIKTADELKAFRDEVNNGNDFKNCKVKLTADIVLPSEEWTPIGPMEEGTHFKGEFDGQGYTIQNLYIRSAKYELTGLFGSLEGRVENIGLINTDISVKTGGVGSVCGEIDDGMVNNCYNTGNVTGLDATGGICGINESGTIMNCYNTGTVIGRTNVGGICGYNSSVLQNSYNIGAITSTQNYSGGICGVNSSLVENCYNTGTVTGPDDVGGVCGYNRGYYLSNCYYLNTSSAKAVGVITGGQTGTDLYSFDTNHKLSAKVTIDGADYESLTNSLNAWVIYQKPYHNRWLYDKDLVSYPVFRYTLDKFEIDFTDSVSGYIYTGDPIEPGVVVSLGTKTLTSGTDYTISYDVNTQVGTGEIIVRGKGNYAGTLKKNFTIEAKPIDDMTVTLAETSYTYDGKAKEPTVTVKDGTKTLVNQTDYTVTYSDNTEIGTATVMITGQGNYTGTRQETFSISELVIKSISSCSVSLTPETYIYDGSEKEPAVSVKDGNTTLKKEIDYTLAYSKNTNVGTATVTITGQGNYAGTLEKTFSIAAKSVDSCILTLSQDIFTYDGSEKRPTVTVKDEIKTLEEGTDYTITYAENTNVGTATVTITGKDNYSGTKTTEFKIEQAKTSEDNKDSGNQDTGNKDTDNKDTDKKDNDSDVTTNPVVIEKVTLSKVTSPSSKKIKATWKKISKVSGYEVQLATNKKFTAGKKSTVIKKNGTVTKTFTGLKKGKTYYVRVRAYKTVDGKKQYGAWSAIKNKKCK